MIRILIVPDGYTSPEHPAPVGCRCAHCGSEDFETIPVELVSLNARHEPWFRQHDYAARETLIELGVIQARSPEEHEKLMGFHDDCYCYIYPGGQVSYAPQHQRAIRAAIRRLAASR